MKRFLKWVMYLFLAWVALFVISVFWMFTGPYFSDRGDRARIAVEVEAFDEGVGLSELEGLGPVRVGNGSWGRQDVGSTEEGECLQIRRQTVFSMATDFVDPAAEAERAADYFEGDGWSVVRIVDDGTSGLGVVGRVEAVRGTEGIRVVYVRNAAMVLAHTYNCGRNYRFPPPIAGYVEVDSFTE